MTWAHFCIGNYAKSKADFVNSRRRVAQRLLNLQSKTVGKTQPDRVKPDRLEQASEPAAQIGPRIDLDRPQSALSAIRLEQRPKATKPPGRGSRANPQQRIVNSSSK